MGDLARAALPRDPIELDRVLELFPTLRQSLLAKFDDCHLSALFELRYARGWNTHPQARGTAFHRFAAEALRTMREMDERTISVPVAMEILYEVLRQEGVPVEDRVRVPLREIQALRMAVRKFAKDNEFSTNKIIDIERRLATDISYTDIDGRRITRKLTGQIDVLIAEPPDGAIVIDWKDTWALPPQRMEPQDDRHEDDGTNISYEGYFQQRFYGLLVFHAYPAVQRVTLREFYPRKTKTREATLHRRDLEFVERDMAMLAQEFDAVIALGTRHAGTLRPEDPWKPSPGKHCDYCLMPGRCPIPDDAREEGMIRNGAQARKVAGQYEVVSRQREWMARALKAWTRVHGPIELKGGKGRRMLGFQERIERHRRKDGRVVKRMKSVFGTFVPDESDRGPNTDDEKLEQAMRESVEEVRQMRRDKS